MSSTSSSPAVRPRPTPDMLADVARGLRAVPKELPPKYFYDRRGSELFEEITRLPEYYLTRTERGLLADWMPTLVPQLGPRALVEFGAGNAEKTRIILDAMLAAGTGRLYVPVDLSAAFLAQSAAQLRRERPELTVEPVVADIGKEVSLPRRLPRPVLVAFLGSTIGNFDPPAAVGLLSRLRSGMETRDRLLLGVDLRKDPARIEAAYNDGRGVTAEFNRNILLVLNRELGADFDPALFEHRAFYAPKTHRIEMHLVSAREHCVTIPELGVFGFRRGESIRTEISCKYDRRAVAELFGAAGLRVDAWRQDAAGLFALGLGAPA